MIVIGEERAQGAVNQTAHENFMLGGAGFAFEEPSWKFSHGGVFLAVFNGEGEEVKVFFDFFGGNNGCEQHGVAHFYDYGSVSLLGEAAGFDADGAAISEIKRFDNALWLHRESF
jgi:hypothetical protein